MREDFWSIMPRKSVGFEERGVREAVSSQKPGWRVNSVQAGMLMTR